MKYAMLSTLIPIELEEEFRRNSSHTMQDAASVLQWNLYSGFCSNLQEDINLFNILPVDSFPQYYKYPFILQSNFGKNGINVGFCNIKLLRNYHKPRKIYKVLNQWCKSERDSKTLFMYTISQPFLKAVWRIKKKYPDLKICAIVADLPNMSSLSSKNGLLRKVYVKNRAADAYKMLCCVDSFVLLTKHMAEYMNIYQPYCVMEGIAAESVDEDNVTQEKDNLKVVMYSGTLHKKFGIVHLLDAFCKITDENYRLIICGTGDSEELIQEAANHDKRIQFKGQLPRKEVLKLQKKATVLVNPRLNNEEYTKYSFPSKTMEYLASGIPVIAYKLDGIPDDYDSYITYPDDNTIEMLADTICTLCEKSHDERLKMGIEAKNFVLENKNCIVQTKKIMDFLESLE